MAYGDNDRSRDRRPPRQQREMFDAVCADCGAACKIPFKPSANGKPVYCKDCYKKYAPEKKRDNRRSLF